ncbi:MAG: TonB-dependent receptor [Rhodocyclaceae bacterium]|nr:TonB-dependent receptor [Rhodocyclaceae bacterium]
MALSTVAASLLAADEMSALLDMDLEELSQVRMVTAAGRFPQKLTEAPSRVTIVTADEIRAFGYRTLADVVRSIRGLYTGYDGSYEIAGTRGISPSGDYNTRLLVMIDGVRITDPVYSQGPVGSEFPIDMALIDRVEFLPGPGSAAYGNNAFMGLLNVITRAPGSEACRAVRLEGGTYGDRGVAALAEGSVGDHARALVSISRRDRSGPDVRFPAGTFEADDDVARGMDRESVNRLFARLDTDDWRFLLVAGERAKHDPTAPFGTIFNDPRMVQDDRYLQASARRTVSVSGDTEGALQAFYNRYEFRGDYPTDYPPPTVNHDYDLGERIGLEGQLRTRHFEGHTLSAWGEWILDPTIRLINRDLAPAETYLDTERSEQSWGVFVQDEIRLAPAWLLNLGLRHDRLSTGQHSANPRLALIHDDGEGRVAKLLYGSAFRAPNAYERFYALDDYSVANPALRAERIRTLEATVEQALASVHLAASVSRSKITDLIELVTREDELVQFANRAGAHVDAVELEADYRAADGLQLRGSFSHQRAVDDASGDWLANSPRNLLKANAIMPAGGGTRLGVEARYESGRRTPVGTRTGGFGVLNLTWSGYWHGVGWSATVRNALDRGYDLPATIDHEPDRLPREGRTLQLGLTIPF